VKTAVLLLRGFDESTILLSGGGLVGIAVGSGVEEGVIRG